MSEPLEKNVTKTPRRPVNALDAAEALFKPAKKVAAAPPDARPALPNVKEQVTLKLDSDVLVYFQEDGPGWQDRINDVLRAAMRNDR
nr:BrnA antitoxin family protein [Rhizobium leguminosarum]